MAFTTNQTIVAETAQAAYGRTLAEDGFTFWTEELILGNHDATSLMEEFMSNRESQLRYPPTADNAVIVQQIFNNVLGRDAAQSGVDFYAAQMTAGDLTTAELVLSIMADAKGLGGGDAAFLNAAVAAAETTYSNNVNATELILNAGQEITNGTTKSDTFRANQNTLESGDEINGDAGTDTLKIDVAGAGNTFSSFQTNSVEAMTIESNATGAVVVDFDQVDSAMATVTSLNTENASLTLRDLQSTSIDLVIDDSDQMHSINYDAQADDGAADSVNLKLTEIRGSNIDFTQGTAAADADIETLNIDSDTTANVVNNLSVGTDLATLNIAGNADLTVSTALDTNIATVDANTHTANLTLDMTASAVATTYTGSQGIDTLSLTNNLNNAVSTGTGADVVTMAGTGDNTVSTGAGDDILTIGNGDNTIDLGDGADQLNDVATGELTVSDTITGGAGYDTLTLEGSDTISLSEAEKISEIEHFVIDDGAANSTTLVVSNTMITTAAGTDVDGNGDDITATADQFSVTTDGADTIDLQNVSFSNTDDFIMNGSTNVDTVIANDSTVNAAATLTFGNDLGLVTAANANTISTGDTLRIVDGATVTNDDMRNITGLNRIELVSDSSEAQIWNLDINSSAIDNWDTTNVGGDNIDNLVIVVDQDVQAGSVLNISSSNLEADQRITVLGNSNVTVNVVPANPSITVRSTLEFTENADNFVGLDTAANDTFVATSLDQVDAADIATATTGGTDTLRLDFGVFGGVTSALLATQLNAANITGMEVVQFNTDNDVSFLADMATEGTTTYTTAGGDDTITAEVAGSPAATFNVGEGNNRVNLDGGVHTVTAGAGTDLVTFVTSTDWTAVDTLTLGAGTDTVNVLTSAANLDISAFTLLSGVDEITWAASGAHNLTISNANVNQSDDTNNLVINHTTATGTGVDASALTTAVNDANIVTMNITTSAAAANFLGGSGADVFNVTTTGAAANIRGNGGADDINLTAVDGVVQNIEYTSVNDGSDNNAVNGTGADVISGWGAGDLITVIAASGLDGLLANDVAGARLMTANDQTDGPVDFRDAGGTIDDILVMTHLTTSATDAEILDFAAVAADANVMGVTAAATDGGLILAQGASDTALYVYTEQDGNANLVDASELKLLAIVDGSTLTAADITVV